MNTNRAYTRYQRWVCFVFILACSNLAFGSQQQPRPAPEFNLPTLTDKSMVSLSSLRDKVVYVDFWASWCGPCRKSFPELNKLYSKLKDDGFEIAAINVDSKEKDAKKFLSKYPVDYLTLYDAEQKTPELYAVQGMPSGYLIDKSGNVRYLHKGFKKKDIPKIEAEIRKLLAEG